MYLDEFYLYKNQLISDILSNEEIVRLIDSDIDVDDSRKLVYTQVFPYEYVPETIEHGETFICCDVDIQSVQNKTFLIPTLFIWVFTHKSKLHLEEGGVRTDKIVSEIDKTINGSKYFGAGELELYSVRRFAPMTDYQGKIMTYHAKEINRFHPTGKEIPSNRRLENANK